MLSAHVFESLHHKVICSHYPALLKFEQESHRSSIAMCIGPAVERRLHTLRVASSCPARGIHFLPHSIHKLKALKSSKSAYNEGKVSFVYYHIHIAK